MPRPASAYGSTHQRFVPIPDVLRRSLPFPAVDPPVRYPGIQIHQEKEYGRQARHPDSDRQAAAV